MPVSSSKSQQQQQQRVVTGSTLSSQTAGHTPSTPVRGGSVATNGTPPVIVKCTPFSYLLTPFPSWIACHTTGTTTSNLVSLTAVVDALETQRRELGARNKELELQVRDLLLALKKQNNSPSKTSRREESEEDEAHKHRNRFGACEHIHCKQHLTVACIINIYTYSQHAGMSTTAQTMYLRLQEQQAEIEALQRQFELKAALLSERQETIVMQRER